MTLSSSQPFSSNIQQSSQQQAVSTIIFTGPCLNEELENDKFSLPWDHRS